VGNWAVIVRGIGPHNNATNNSEGDANRLAAKFVQALYDAGQQVVSEVFVSGNEESIDGDAYIERLEEGE